MAKARSKKSTAGPPDPDPQARRKGAASKPARKHAPKASGASASKAPSRASKAAPTARDPVTKSGARRVIDRAEKPKPKNEPATDSSGERASRAAKAKTRARADGAERKARSPRRGSAGSRESTSTDQAPLRAPEVSASRDVVAPPEIAPGESIPAAPTSVRESAPTARAPSSSAGMPARPTTPPPPTPPAASPAPAAPPPPGVSTRPPPAPPAVTTPPKPIPVQSMQFGDEEGWAPLDDADAPVEDEEARRARAGALLPSGPPPPGAGEEEGWVALSEDEVPSTAAPRAPIPPLPDEDDVFEPIELEDEGPPREPPPGATPHDVLEAVWKGRLHVSAMNAISDEMVEALAEGEGLVKAPGERRADLMRRLIEHRPPEPVRPPVDVEGLLDVVPEGFGFIRRALYGYQPATSDPFVPPGPVRELALRSGHWITARARPPRSDERYPEVVEILGVNHEDPEAARELAPFDSLTVTHPDKRFILETDPEQVSMRMMDLFCPLGRGQRALVVSPPRAGKTLLLQGIADSLARNSPEVDIVVLLVDERPEEVTNMRRSIRGEVFASTFDQPPHRHIRLAELVLEKVKRMVEFGRNVVLLLDSLTRLGRAYNNETHGAGRLLTGGLEATALTKPKAFFGAARNIEDGGSLTIVASALVDTGSRLDQVIFEEFKGTGNMEIALSRDLANRRLWPAIDIPRSGTRKEDLLLHPEELKRVTILRRAMAGQEAPEVLTDLLYRMERYRTNAEFLMNVQT